MKFLSLIGCGPLQSRTEFREWFLRQHAPVVLEKCPGVRSYIVHFNDVSPRMAAQPINMPLQSPYEIVTEMSVEPANASQRAAEVYEATAGSNAVEHHPGSQPMINHTYLVSDIVEKDQQSFPQGERSRGVNLVSVITWAQGKSDAEGRRGWQNHGPLACRIHIGMTRYVRNVIEQALTPGAPAYNGVAVLYFPTQEDLEQRLYDSPKGAEAIAADVRGFVNLDNIITFYTSQYVLKS